MTHLTAYQKLVAQRISKEENQERINDMIEEAARKYVYKNEEKAAGQGKIGDKTANKYYGPVERGIKEEEKASTLEYEKETKRVKIKSFLVLILVRVKIK